MLSMYLTKLPQDIFLSETKNDEKKVSFFSFFEIKFEEETL